MLIDGEAFAIFLQRRHRSHWGKGSGLGWVIVGHEGTTVISPPRGGPRDHGRGYPLSVLTPAVEGFRRQSEKKSRRQKFSPNLGEEVSRENKFGRWPNPGPSPDAKHAVIDYISPNATKKAFTTMEGLDSF
ncbi:hypothetical protein Acr_04g0006860 [Actinidia rufa]|uniref:Uncharacterized protein n=1 Tax=Actinidia rufa TaxID=165716 RepID=A0A7J0EHK0_9ERIC|nr:hypothetical protein Acr_04g0006860 [Actinidia rufa]